MTVMIMQHVFFVQQRVVVMQATILLILDLIPTEGHHSQIVLFGNKMKEVANNVILAVCPIVSHDYNDHAT